MHVEFIHGRLARDPELTKDATDENKNRCKFTIASDRRYGDEADFLDCIVFGKRANVIDKYFRQGSEIVVIGERQGRSYEDKNGVKRKSWTVNVWDFDFCGSKGNGSTSAPKQEETKAEQWTEQEGDIPF